jgi:hypothetical protein
MKHLVELLFISIICALVSPLVPCIQGADDKGKALRPCVVISGTDSHITEQKCYRVTSAKEWSQLWQVHKGRKATSEYDEYYDRLTLPMVDFDRYMVIAVFRGLVDNNAGLSVASINEEQSRIIFRFWDKVYQTNLTSEDDRVEGKATVYGFFIVPHSKKRLVVQEDTEGRYMDEAPVWKELAVFQSQLERNPKKKGDKSKKKLP